MRKYPSGYTSIHNQSIEICGDCAMRKRRNDVCLSCQEIQEREKEIKEQEELKGSIKETIKIINTIEDEYKRLQEEMCENIENQRLQETIDTIEDEYKRLQEQMRENRDRKETIDTIEDEYKRLQKQMRKNRDRKEMMVAKLKNEQNELKIDKIHKKYRKELLSENFRIHTGTFEGKQVKLETHCTILRLKNSSEDLYFGHVTLVITYPDKIYRWHYGVKVDDKLPETLNHEFWQPKENNPHYSEKKLVREFGTFTNIPNNIRLSDMMESHFKDCITFFYQQPNWPVNQIWDKDSVNRLGDKGEIATETLQRLMEESDELKELKAERAILGYRTGKLQEKKIEARKKLKQEIKAHDNIQQALENPKRLEDIHIEQEAFGAAPEVKGSSSKKSKKSKAESSKQAEPVPKAESSKQAELEAKALQKQAERDSKVLKKKAALDSQQFKKAGDDKVLYEELQNTMITKLQEERKQLMNLSTLEDFRLTLEKINIYIDNINKSLKEVKKWPDSEQKNDTFDLLNQMFLYDSDLHNRLYKRYCTIIVNEVTDKKLEFNNLESNSNDLLLEMIKTYDSYLKSIDDNITKLYDYQDKPKFGMRLNFEITYKTTDFLEYIKRTIPQKVTIYQKFYENEIKSMQKMADDIFEKEENLQHISDKKEAKRSLIKLYKSFIKKSKSLISVMKEEESINTDTLYQLIATVKAEEKILEQPTLEKPTVKEAYDLVATYQDKIDKIHAIFVYLNTLEIEVYLNTLEIEANKDFSAIMFLLKTYDTDIKKYIFEIEHSYFFDFHDIKEQKTQALEFLKSRANQEEINTLKDDLWEKYCNNISVYVSQMEDKMTDIKRGSQTDEELDTKLIQLLAEYNTSFFDRFAQYNREVRDIAISVSVRGDRFDKITKKTLTLLDHYTKRFKELEVTLHETYTENYIKIIKKSIHRIEQIEKMLKSMTDQEDISKWRGILIKDYEQLYTNDKDIKNYAKNTIKDLKLRNIESKLKDIFEEYKQIVNKVDVEKKLFSFD